MKKIFPIFLLFLLQACSSNTDIGQQETEQFCSNTIGYCIQIPANLERLLGENDIPVFVTPLEVPQENSYHIQPYHRNDTDVQFTDYFRTSCKDSVLNSVLREQSEFTYTVSGKFPGYPCEVDSCDDTQYGMDQFKGRYILCSEHKGKTVLIEVNQVTDNPELAEEIFKTFKWLEE